MVPPMDHQQACSNAFRTAGPCLTVALRPLSARCRRPCAGFRCRLRAVVTAGGLPWFGRRTRRRAAACRPGSPVAPVPNPSPRSARPRCRVRPADPSGPRRPAGRIGRCRPAKLGSPWTRKLAIPPAWQNVWISPSRNASGCYAKDRKQYRYHPRWRTLCDETKFERMLAFGRALPRIRATVAAERLRLDRAHRPDAGPSLSGPQGLRRGVCLGIIEPKPDLVREQGDRLAEGERLRLHLIDLSQRLKAENHTQKLCLPQPTAMLRLHVSAVEHLGSADQRGTRTWLG